MALFKVSFLIKVSRNPRSGLSQTLILPGYSIELTYFILNRSDYKSISILITTISCPLLLLGYLVLDADIKRELFGCFFC